MRKTALHTRHCEAEAKMVPFAGWEMPLYYRTGATEEHRLVRRSAGLFDVSHMGTFEIEGKGCLDFLNRVITSGVHKTDVGMAGYGLLLNDRGTIIDDIFLYHTGENQWTLVVNASNLKKDWDWLSSQKNSFDCILKDVSSKTALIAMQGPAVIVCLGGLLGEDLSGWTRFGIKEFVLEGISFRCGRTGYTGEDGVEIFVASEKAAALWTILLDQGGKQCEIAPCGLAARDSLRFEPGFPLYGHELNETVFPPEALLKWACDFETDFIGKAPVEELIKKGLTRKLITFKMIDKGVPREDYEILSAQGDLIGKVVSGLYAPTLDLYCGNGFVPVAFAKTGTEIGISVRGRIKKAEVVKRPLYRPVYR